MREQGPRSSVLDKAAEIVALYGMGLLMGLVVEADTAWTWRSRAWVSCGSSWRDESRRLG